MKELASHREELSADELRERAEQARERLEAAGEIDTVEDQQGVGADAAPTFDSLVGKTIEIRWRYWSNENGKRKQVHDRLPCRLSSMCMCMLLLHACTPFCSCGNAGLGLFLLRLSSYRKLRQHSVGSS